MREILVALVLVTGTVASAQGHAVWGEAGGWRILVDPSTGNGCLAERAFEDGTLVQIGTDPSREGGFFAAYNADWTNIEDGAPGVVNFDFGDARFAGDVLGKIYNTLPGGYAFFDNPSFVAEFAKRRSVKVSGESGRIIEINLTGTAKAIETVLKCQGEQPDPSAD